MLVRVQSRARKESDNDVRLFLSQPLDILPAIDREGVGVRTADKTSVQNLLLLIRKYGNSDNITMDEVSYSLGDMVAVFRKESRSSVFTGMSFTIFSRDFYILENLEVTTVVEPSRDVVVIEDPHVIRLINENLQWRCEAIELLGY